MRYVLNVIILDCIGLKTTWTNMKTDKQFPVSTGAVLSLSCNVGYELRGDKTVICTTNTKFQYSVEPACGMYNYEQNFNLIFSLVLTLTYLRYSYENFVSFFSSLSNTYNLFFIPSCYISSGEPDAILLLCAQISERVCPGLSIDNAQVSPSGDVTEGNTVTVRCLKPKHYVLHGNKEVTCQPTGWSTKEPECKKCGKSKILSFTLFRTQTTI